MKADRLRHALLTGIVVLSACGGNPVPDGQAPAPDYLPEPPKVTGPRIDVKPVVQAPPFVGEEGNDPHGYPLRRPDMAVMLSTLRLRRFEALEQWMEHYQEAFAKDHRKEDWPDTAVSAFFVADPSLGELLDEWTKHSPDHFAPWVARGNYRFKMGQHFRGGAFAKYTSLAQFKSMGEFHDAAFEDFERALALEPGLVAAHRRMIQMAKADSGDAHDARAYLNAAVAQCELTFNARALYMHALMPRWGGSYAKMDAYLQEIQPLVARSPKLALLAGYPHWDRCRTAKEAKNLVEAAVQCDAALAAGDHPDFLVQRSYLYEPDTDADKIAQLLDRALRLDPQNRPALRRRYRARAALEDYLGAARDILMARHLEPDNTWVAGRVAWITDVLRFQGQALSKAGKDAEALPYFTLGLQLAPDDRDLRHRAAWSQKQVGLAGLDAQIALDPDNFELRLQRDHGLAALGKYDEVEKMWDEFIARHPADPRPHWERAGAIWQQDRKLDGIADMDRSCELGLQKACDDAKRMRAMAGSPPK